MISCCGVTLPPLEAEQADDEHQISCEKIENEWFVSMQHPMTKEHYISFVAYCTGERFESDKALSGKQHRSALFLPGAWNIVLVL